MMPEMDFQETKEPAAEEEPRFDPEFGTGNPKEAREQSPRHISQPREQARPEKERWNKPRGNIYRFAVTLYSFIIMGMNDAVIGVCRRHMLI